MLALPLLFAMSASLLFQRTSAHPVQSAPCFLIRFSDYTTGSQTPPGEVDFLVTAAFPTGTKIKNPFFFDVIVFYRGQRGRRGQFRHCWGWSIPGCSGRTGTTGDKQVRKIVSSHRGLP